MILIENILEELSTERPIFHSEADFQHALAWQIHERHRDARIRLETNIGLGDRREYVDILVGIENKKYPIELKYKTKKLDIVDKHGEEFHLLNQSAQDIGRYDFIKDITRVERFVDANPGSTGWAILLTNDRTYWEETKRKTVDEKFRVHHGRVLDGVLEWGIGVSKGTTRGRAEAHRLNRLYELRWADYFSLEGVENQDARFRYLLVEIASKDSGKDLSEEDEKNVDALTEGLAQVFIEQLGDGIK